MTDARRPDDRLVASVSLSWGFACGTAIPNLVCWPLDPWMLLLAFSSVTFAFFYELWMLGGEKLGD